MKKESLQCKDTKHPYPHYQSSFGRSSLRAAVLGLSERERNVAVLDHVLDLAAHFGKVSQRTVENTNGIENILVKTKRMIQ